MIGRRFRRIGGGGAILALRRVVIARDRSGTPEPFEHADDFGLRSACRKRPRREGAHPLPCHGNAPLRQQFGAGRAGDRIGLCLMAQTPQQMSGKALVGHRALPAAPPFSRTVPGRPLPSSHLATMPQAGSPSSTRCARSAITAGGIARRRVIAMRA